MGCSLLCAPTKMKDIHKHFSEIASEYRDLRVLDFEPVLYICRQFDGMPKIQGLDVGCGTGRYDLALFHNLGERLFLHCIDNNEEMLNQLIHYLQEKKVKNFETKCCFARSLPFEDKSLDCVFSFNAIHHLEILDFLSEVSRILRRSSFLFIYTRTPAQNSRNIWGRFFPLFNEKEKRLYEEDEFKNILEEIPALKLKKIVHFIYDRDSGLDRLLKQARGHHYSTFCFYDDDEFEECLIQFEENIKENFQDLSNITWNEENILYCIEKRYDSRDIAFVKRDHN